MDNDDQDWFVKHRVASRLFFMWAAVMVTMLILHYIDHPLGSANTADGVILTAVLGLPTAAVAFVQWVRERRG